MVIKKAILDLIGQGWVRSSPLLAYSLVFPRLSIHSLLSPLHASSKN